MADAILEARRLVKSYGSGDSVQRVLKGLDLAVEAGQFTVILGPSGSGKSTVLNVLGLMDRPDQGEVLFSGRPVSALGEEERCALRNERLGFVFQFDSLLPEFTILENVMMPARIARGRGQGPTLGEAEERALKLLDGLHLSDLRGRFPSQTSGGERQRAALARALINRPAVLLADEPTGNLDKRNGELVFKDLRDLAESHGVAVLMVTHNEAARAFAARVLHMADGVLTEEAQHVR